jgi:tRNA (mo5U34)-methyltransferase
VFGYPAGVIDAPAIRDEIIRLGPWHYDIEVVPGLSTRVCLEAPPDTYPDSYGPVSFLPRRLEDDWKHMMRLVYPQGLEGRSVLDVACNCGIYLHWARDIGAGRCYGVDVHSQWIEQAHFLQRHGLLEGVTCEVGNLYDLPAKNLPRFDVTWFGGIFYHLPDPVSGLKVAADLTNELLLINTATKNGLPDGLLAVGEESKEGLLSGVYGLNWFPTGPETLRAILAWLGFPAMRVLWHITQGEGQPLELGRMQLLAARDERLFAHYDSVTH